MRGTVSEAYEAQDDLVERVHQCLAQAIQRSRRGSVGAPVTVAEIYQDLVPYRAIRSTVGFQMNADYEHTLLRLLSGEGGYARLEPSEARDELRSELDSPNPNVGLFRKFAACDVYVAPGPRIEEEDEVELEAGESDLDGVGSTVPPDLPTLEASEGGETTSNEAGPDVLPAEDWQPDDTPWEEPALWAMDEPELLLEEEVETADPVGEPAHRPEPVTAEPAQSTGASPMYETKSTSVATASPGQACAFCTSALPSGRMVRFCPHCGQDQAMQPCRGCQEPLDASWKFCIACGASQQS
jgi:hypothetical protein